MTAEEVLDWLRSMRTEVGQFDRTTYREDRWVRWHNEMRSTLRRLFGEDSYELKGYYGASDWGRPIAGFSQSDIDDKMEAKFTEILGVIRGWLDALILQVERFGVETGVNGGSSSPGSTHDVGIPKRYKYTSLAYLTESLWTWLGHAAGWAWQHKIHSTVLGVTTVVGSIASIAGLLVALGAI